MYPPALKGLFNFPCMRPHTHDCNYVQQRSIGGNSPVTGLHLFQINTFPFRLSESVNPFHAAPLQRKMTEEEKRGEEKMNRTNQLVVTKSRALIKNREIKTQAVTQPRWKEKQDKIKPRRQPSTPWLRLISRAEERKCCSMKIQPGRPAAGRGGDAERPGRQRPRNSLHQSFW